MIAHAQEHPHQQPDQAREHSATGMAGAMHAHAGHDDHAAMVADFRRSFWLCLALTPLVLLLSPMIQHGLGLGDALRFRGDGLALFALSSFIYVLWRVAVPDRLRGGVQEPRTGHDDAGRGRDFGRLFLFGGGDFRLSRRVLLLGSGDAHRRHAARPLARDAFGHGSVARLGRAGPVVAGHGREAR
jgi:hypothetical protein